MAPDDEDLDDELEGEDYDDEDHDGPQTEVTIEVTGLSLYTHHGVTAA
jgi:7,8-dihydroneopterin aldolase/epimerase/oxygenase